MKQLSIFLLFFSPVCYGQIPLRMPIGGITYSYYATFNPINRPALGTLTNGRLTVTSTSSAGQFISTIGESTGKYYIEYTITAAGAGKRLIFGLVNAAANQTTIFGNDVNGFAVISIPPTGIFTHNGGGSYLPFASGVIFDVGDLVALAWDAGAGTLDVYYSASGSGTRTLLGTAYPALSAGTYYPACGDDAGTTFRYTVNFGATPYAFTPPAGYGALHH